MDFESTVEAIVAGVLIAKFIGFVGGRMYETVLMAAGDEGAAGVVMIIGVLGWLAVLGGVLVVLKFLGH